MPQFMKHLLKNWFTCFSLCKYYDKKGFYTITFGLLIFRTISINSFQMRRPQIVDSNLYKKTGAIKLPFWKILKSLKRNHNQLETNHKFEVVYGISLYMSRCLIFDKHKYNILIYYDLKWTLEIHMTFQLFCINRTS